MNPGWRGQYLRYKSYLLNMVAQYRDRTDVRAYLEVLLSLATISIFSVFALRPTLLTIAELTKDIDSKESTIQVLDTKIENLVAAENLFAAQRRNIELLTQAVPSEPQPDMILLQIQGIATQYPTLTIRNLAIEETTLIGNPPQLSNDETLIDFPGESLAVSFNFSAQADYQILSQFLKDLENLLRPVHIDTLSFSTVDSNLEGGEIVLVINSRTPYLK